jgi:histidinol-phosphatase
MHKPVLPDLDILCLILINYYYLLNQYLDMNMNGKNLARLFKFSEKIVKQASSITMGYFNIQSSAALKTTIKKDNSPVTVADFKCENFLIKKIKSAYPEHDVLSEESGEENKGSEFKWIIDPIDGTKNFIRGIPFWGTLLALEYQGETVIGIISMPATGHFVTAMKSGGCRVNGKRVKVSKINKIEKAYVLYGGLNSILKKNYKENFFKLVSKSFQSRSFGDCHGHLFVINGSAEIMIDPSVAPYDIAATEICVKEAGGKLTDVNGNGSIYNKSALITNGILHNKALKMLSA